MTGHTYPALSCGNHDENHGQHIHVIDGRAYACFGYTAPETGSRIHSPDLADSIAHSAEKGLRPRCPGCGHSCCPYPGLECGGESDMVRACDEETRVIPSGTERGDA